MAPPSSSQSRGPDDLLISIQLNSNQPVQIVTFLDALEKTACRPEKVEVLINIDTGDAVIKGVLDEQKSLRKLRIRYIETILEGGFFGLWKPLNALVAMTDPTAYYVMNVSDEFIFLTQGWDKIIETYIGYYPDHIFRLRASQFRFRNYRDFWECGYAPDSLAIYTKRWFDISGDWNPCFGPDAFQQCISFYLYTYNGMMQRQMNRDIPEPFLRFKGEGVSLNMPPEKIRQRNKGHVHTWFILMSHAMQQEASRRAALLRSDIEAQARKMTAYRLNDNRQRKRIEICDAANGGIVDAYPYRLSWLRITFAAHWRKFQLGYYTGGYKPSQRYSIVSLTMYPRIKYDWPFKLFKIICPTEKSRQVARELLLSPGYVRGVVSRSLKSISPRKS